MKTNPVNLPKIIKAHRRRHKLTLPELSAKIGVNKRTLENYEQGLRTPRGLALEALLERLGAK